MDAAKDLALLLDPVANDPAAAARAGRCQRVDRTFKAVEHVRLPSQDDLERLIVIIPADFAFGHAVTTHSDGRSRVSKRPKFSASLSAAPVPGRAARVSVRFPSDTRKSGCRSEPRDGTGS